MFLWPAQVSHERAEANRASECRVLSLHHFYRVLRDKEVTTCGFPCGHHSRGREICGHVCSRLWQEGTSLVVQ